MRVIKLKKLGAVTLAMLTATGLLSGCGGNADGNVDGTSETSEALVSDNNEVNEEINNEEKIEVEFWYAGGKTAVGIIQSIVDEYNSTQNKYFVKTIVQADYNETYQKLQASIAGNVAPDLALLNAEPAYNLQKKDLLQDLGEYINSDNEFQKDDYIEVFYNQGVDGEKVYALPAYGSTQIMYYNKAAFESAGIDADSLNTWQDLVEASSELKEKGGAEYVWEPMWGSDNLVDVAFSNGAKLISDDGKNVLINSEEWIEVWESFRTWINDDKTMAIHSGGEGWEYWYQTMDDAVSGKAAGYTGSSGDQADLDFSVVGAMEQLAWSNEGTSGDASVATPTAEAKQLVVVSASLDEEKAGAYDFIKYFTNPDNQADWSIQTGYVPVRISAQDTEAYKNYSAEHPEILVPLNQATHASIEPIDPTGGEIYDALKIAADKIEIEGISAEEALNEAAETAQKALDKELGN